jgi:hypothetical protein
MRKVRPRARLALAASPLGNLAAEKADQPKELAWRAGKALPEERKFQDLRRCWGPWSEGSSWSYQDPNLTRYELLLYELSSDTQ